MTQFTSIVMVYLLPYPSLTPTVPNPYPFPTLPYPHLNPTPTLISLPLP